MSSLPAITATLIFLTGMIDDLRSRKFHNWLFITTATIAFLVAGMTSGWHGLLSGVMGFMVGMLVLMPLVLARVIGAGDMKLLAAGGVLLGWSAAIDVAIYGFIWGAIFGLLQVILKGQLRATVGNMLGILSRRAKSETRELHTIPFTVGLFLGWLTHLARTGVLP
jgi:prepilin peptidase CpaA